MNKDGIQLEMRFENDANRFRNRLENGIFSVFIEIGVPSRKTDFNTALAQFSDFDFAVSKIDYLHAALAITDKAQAADSWNVADFASGLINSQRDNHLIYLSGRNTSLGELRETMELCRASGFKNVIPVSGDALPGEGAKETAAKTFTESVHLHKVSVIKEGDNEKSILNAGCVFNPFKYTPQDIYPQYFKLIKKLAHGANFIVTQAGWDMLKLQELRWHLTHRGLHYPSIARLLLLTPEKVTMIANGKLPGIHISPDFQGVLEKEVKYSRAQFESAQWRRIQLQAAGARLLGYSGVQIAGLTSAYQAQVACRRISEALEEFKDFNDWKNAYQEHFSRMEMAPYPHRFYMFDKLFTRAHLDSVPKMKEGKLPECTKTEKLQHKLREFLFSHSHKQPSDEHSISKRLFADCKGCSYCRLPLTQYICPELCPKGLSNGPCGGTKADGSCELSSKECVHTIRMRLATWLNEIDTLEELYIEPAAKQ